MIKIKSKINNNITFNIDTKYITEQEQEEIENINLDIAWSDTRLIHWSFDTKLTSGRWLENIVYNNELTQAKALII